MKTKNQASYLYPYITWILTLIFSPLFFLMVHYIMNGKFPKDTRAILPILYLFGTICSLPTLIFSVVIFHFFYNQKISNLQLKSILHIVFNLGIFLTFLYIGGSGVAFRKLTWTYCITLTIFIWVVKMKRQQTDL